MANFHGSTFKAEDDKYGESMNYIEPEFGVNLSTNSNNKSFKRYNGPYYKQPSIEGKQMTRNEYDMKKGERRIKFNDDSEYEDINLEITSVNLQTSAFINYTQDSNVIK